MNNKYFEHIRMFFFDHIWILLLFFFAPFGFMVIGSHLLYRQSFGMIYYLLLSTFIALVFMGYRLYATWDLYEILLGDADSIEDYQLEKPKCRIENHYKKIISNINHLHLRQISALENERSEGKNLIYRWIHQVKTPLSVIRLIVGEKTADNDLKKLSLAANEIEYDLEQILNLYKLDSIESDFHTEHVVLSNLVRDCINDLKSLFISRNVYPKLEMSGDTVVITDYKWLKFVLYQLLTNAVKYSDPGQTVTVSVTENKKPTELCISDRGCGIDPCDIGRIYDLFFTGRNGRLRGESSGLGLYMVKKVLGYLRHSVTVESETGVGTVFRIQF